MRAGSAVLLCILLTLLIVGCDKRPSPAGAAVTSVSPPIDTTQHVEPITMSIGDHVYDFPSVKLVVSTQDDQLSALLLSDEPPPNATGYQDNNVYLQMTMDIPTTNTLAGAEWAFKSDDTDRNDELDGIYLNGRKQFLQPRDVTVKIEDAASLAKLSIRGKFLKFDDESEHPEVGSEVNVQATLTATVKIEPPK